MMVKVLSPGMQHRQKADAGAQVSWVGADPQKSFGGSAKEHVINRPLVLEREWREQLR
jgi:hypothetical protein